jgi:hypothetical protein
MSTVIKDIIEPCSGDAIEYFSLEPEDGEPLPVAAGIFDDTFDDTFE